MNFGLSQKTVNKLRSFILNIPEIEDLKVFGSRAIGSYKEGSDIDLVLYGTLITPQIIRHLLVKYADLNLPYKLDLIHYETISNPELKKHIDQYALKFE